MVLFHGGNSDINSDINTMGVFNITITIINMIKYG